MSFRRRVRVLALLGGTAAFAVAGSAMAPASQAPAMTTYKTPTCGCCRKWVDHAKASGFQVATRDLPDLSEVKAEMGVLPKLQSCHTTIVGGYVIEGHVPADLVKRLLKEKPAGVVGLAAPGMPQGSPGMEGLIKEKYDIVAWKRDGSTSVYATR